MQIVEFPSPVMNVLAIILYWAALQILIPLICLKIGDRHLSPYLFLFKTRKWEKNGNVYKKLFKIKRWKKLLPDGGAVIKSGFKKRHIDTSSKEVLEKFTLESCRGELVHWLLIIPFWTVGFIAPPIVVVYMFIYALIANLPCIIAQRYNRPRVLKLISRIETRINDRK
jgi:glycosyl-4,4'-diaponeurosporenoate acyltransferase